MNKFPVIGVKHVEEMVDDPFAYADKVKQYFKEIKKIENSQAKQEGQLVDHAQVKPKSHLSQQQLKQALEAIKGKSTQDTENQLKTTQQPVDGSENELKKEAEAMITRLDKHIKTLEKDKEFELTGYESSLAKDKERKDESKEDIIEWYDAEIEIFKDRLAQLKEQMTQFSVKQQKEDHNVAEEGVRVKK